MDVENTKMFRKQFIALFCGQEMLVERFRVKIGYQFSVELNKVEDCEMDMETIKL